MGYQNSSSMAGQHLKYLLNCFLGKLILLNYQGHFHTGWAQVFKSDKKSTANSHWTTNYHNILNDMFSQMQLNFSHEWNQNKHVKAIYKAGRCIVSQLMLEKETKKYSMRCVRQCTYSTNTLQNHLCLSTYFAWQQTIAEYKLYRRYFPVSFEKFKNRCISEHKIWLNASG